MQVVGLFGRQRTTVTAVTLLVEAYRPRIVTRPFSAVLPALGSVMVVLGPVAAAASGSAFPGRAAEAAWPALVVLAAGAPAAELAAAATGTVTAAAATAARVVRRRDRMRVSDVRVGPMFEVPPEREDSSRVSKCRG
ncbi:hypothetical protein GCM10009811_31550 [Nostocoides veronense]|uniref:Uncharacterized protein n=1 Tax=Nostocoides veronense TaxID=330836 RepID=A0ABP4Y6W5_9MICO